MELSRGDGSVGTIAAVQAGLALRSIVACGSPEQIAQWAPRLATAEVLGAFALTEPDARIGLRLAGDPRRARRRAATGISGEKKWIGNGSLRRGVPR